MELPTSHDLDAKDNEILEVENATNSYIIFIRQIQQRYMQNSRKFAAVCVEAVRKTKLPARHGSRQRYGDNQAFGAID